MTNGFEIILVMVIVYLFIVFHDRVRDWCEAWRKSRQQRPSHQPSPLTTEAVKDAMKHRTFGTFTLPPAVVFFKAGDNIPTEGYKVRKTMLPDGRFQYQVIISVSVEKILDLFDTLVSLLGEHCHVVVQDFGSRTAEHVDYFAYQKDTVIVRSILCDFEELLLSDGFIGLVVYSEVAKAEIQLTQHKIIQIFALDLRPFRQVLNRYGIVENPELRFLFEDFHLLVEYVDDRAVLQSLKERLCVESMAVQSDGFEGAYN